jgi:hypothetical protein
VEGAGECSDKPPGSGATELVGCTVGAHYCK